ncbi:hypothetical protein [Dasania marina]
MTMNFAHDQQPLLKAGADETSSLNYFHNLAQRFDQAGSQHRP